MSEKYPLALPEGTALAGQYIIEKVLGQGGFGITYKAVDHTSGQNVAVKEFFPDAMATRTGTTVVPFSGERGESFEYGKACFLQEAETLAQFIGNENIVRIYTYFEENGTAYFVMEYIEGTSFDVYIKEHGGKITFDEAAAVLIPIMDALNIVHSKGIVHRDVTPDNIYITNSGVVKLLDFGAARYSLGDKSRSLDVVLKHGFAPKEQYTRRGKQGPYTDVYSLGASFYFALTGKRPPDSVERMDEDELVPPSNLGAKIGRVPEQAILNALNVQPQDRFQTMAAFKNAMLGAQVIDAQEKAAAGANTALYNNQFGGGGSYGDQTSYGNQQTSYGGQQNSYGGQQNSYGGQQNSYGGQQNSYGGQQNSYGGGSYGSQSGSYPGGQNTPYGSNSGGGSYSSSQKGSYNGGGNYPNKTVAAKSSSSKNNGLMIGLIIGGAVLAAIIIFVVIIAASSSKKKQEAKNTTEYTTQATTTATDDTTYTTTEADTTDTTTEATTETTTEATTEVATGDMYPDIYGVPDNICYGGLLAFSSDGQEFDIDRKNSRILKYVSGGDDIEIDSGSNVFALSVAGSRLYYIKNNVAWSCNLDGTGKEMVPELLSFSDLEQLYVSDDYFFAYRCSSSKRVSRLVQVSRTTGKTVGEMIFDYESNGDEFIGSYLFTLNGGYLYYIGKSSDGRTYNSSEQNRLWRIPLGNLGGTPEDTTVRIKCDCEEVISNDDYVFILCGTHYNASEIVAVSLSDFSIVNDALWDSNTYTFSYLNVRNGQLALIGYEGGKTGIYTIDISSSMTNWTLVKYAPLDDLGFCFDLNVIKNGFFIATTERGTVFIPDEGNNFVYIGEDDN